MEEDKLKSKIIEIWKKVVNRETIAYIIAGVLTTIVNITSYEGLYLLGLKYLTANAWAWVIAVTFAYVVNKKNVFLSKSSSLKDEVSKIIKFFGSRVITLVIEQLGMFLFIDRLGYHQLIVKLSLSVIITILNYVFSKIFVFQKEQPESTR